MPHAILRLSYIIAWAPWGKRNRCRNVVSVLTWAAGFKIALNFREGFRETFVHLRGKNWESEVSRRIGLWGLAVNMCPMRHDKTHPQSGLNTSRMIHWAPWYLILVSLQVDNTSTQDVAVTHLSAKKV